MLNHTDFWGPVSRVMCSSSNRMDLSGGGMGEWQSITIRVCGRAIRNRMEISADGVDEGPVQLHPVDSHGMGRIILPRRHLPHWD